jgi:dTDP-4-amino-4,6-dideoxygalactose transaminase
LVREFERRFAARHQVPYALATTSCTAALHLAALTLGLGPGDEVVVPAFTWVTSAHCAEYVGAKAIFADIDLETYNLDPAALEAAITPRTRAVVVVHLFGLAARMDEILAIARRRDLRIIEDAACAVGTTYDGQPVGALGDMGCFSFHPRKIITTGEGGMVTMREAALRDQVASLRNHGTTGVNPQIADKPYAMGNFDNLGYNLRLSDIQAAVGLAQLEKLDALLVERRVRASRYHELLGDLDEVILPVTPARCGHTYQSYVIRLRTGGLERRNRVMEQLAARDIQTRPGTHAVHRLGYYRDKYHLRPEMFPNACLGEDSTITLPLFPGMTDGDQEQVAKALADALM